MGQAAIWIKYKRPMALVQAAFAADSSSSRMAPLIV